MTTACSCNYGLGNSKTPGCEPLMGVTHGLIFVPTFKTDGTRNKLLMYSKNDLSELAFSFSQVALEALVNNADKNLRWRPMLTSKFEEVEIQRSDSRYKKFASGTSYFIESGELTFKATLPKAGPGVVRFFDSARCEDVSVYIVDRQGNLVGSVTDGEYLFPLRIARQTIDAKTNYAVDDNIHSVMLRFDFASTEEDANLAMVEASSIAYDVRQLSGLYDANFRFEEVTATGFVVHATTFYGSPYNRNAITGMVKADFVLTDTLFGTPIVITSVSEGVDGTYAFVIPSTPAGVLSLSATYTGYDFELASTQLIRTP